MLLVNTLVRIVIIVIVRIVIVAIIIVVTVISHIIPPPLVLHCALQSNVFNPW